MLNLLKVGVMPPYSTEPTAFDRLLDAPIAVSDPKRGFLMPSPYKLEFSPSTQEQVESEIS